MRPNPDRPPLTNQRAELFAIWRALEYPYAGLPDATAPNPNPFNYIGIVTDSEYAINIFNQANMAHTNLDLIDITRARVAKLQPVFAHTLGHKEDAGELTCPVDHKLFMSTWNNVADKLSNTYA